MFRDPAYLTDRYERVLEAIRAAMPTGTPHLPNATPVNLDPPAHGQYQAPLQTAFAPKAMLALKEDTRTRQAKYRALLRDLAWDA
jgi:hypothetical protein